jgi:hypothetical protein
MLERQSIDYPRRSPSGPDDLTTQGRGLFLSDYRPEHVIAALLQVRNDAEVIALWTSIDVLKEYSTSKAMPSASISMYMDVWR